MSSNIKEQLLQEIEKTPDSTLKEVLDFLLFIKTRELQQEQLEISLLSEPSLAKDWLTPEEDEAWQHLQKAMLSLSPFPSSDLTNAKRRPALVLAELTKNDFILCLITSQATNDPYTTLIENSDFETGSLNKTATLNQTESLQRMNN